MQVNVMQVNGPWDVGYVLDKHVLSSELIGQNAYGHNEYKTVRTEVGEAAYQLKYKSDYSKIQPLASAIATQIVPRLGFISFVAPMPPSKTRARQPVVELAREVGRLIGKPCLEDVLVKNGTTPQMKDIPTREEKTAALLGCFGFNDKLSTEGRFNVLLVDDLYSSGASFEAACTTLRQYPKIQYIYVAAVSRTK